MSLELLLLGTGTSSCVPSVGCLTASPTGPRPGCACCLSTRDGTAAGQRNVRRNTSAVLRIPSVEADGSPGRTKTLLIDCGKSFYTGALEHWPKRGLREIDAVLLTHPHSDAVGGLDDLRGWTLHGHIQTSIDIYCNQTTFDAIDSSTPYLTDRNKATGGGDVPQLVFHIFEDGSKSFEVLGVKITPLPVHHGKIFANPSSTAVASSPAPYFCLGFLFDAAILYLSDVSFIPEIVYDAIGQECELPAAEQPLSSRVNGISLNGHQGGTSKKPRLQGLFIDCLRQDGHTSHFGLPQAVESGRRLGAERTYLMGFGHAASHQNWVGACEAFSRGQTSTLAPQLSGSVHPTVVREPKSEHLWQAYGGTADPAVEDVEVFTDQALWRIESWEGCAKGGYWIRPGCDGLLFSTGSTVGDDVYP